LSGILFSSLTTFLVFRWRGKGDIILSFPSAVLPPQSCY
jgi:hypothetical protein